MAFNKLTVGEAERLALLLEELGEAQQAIGKILRHGYSSHHPDRTAITNRFELEKELGDVLAAIQIMQDAEDIFGGNLGHQKAKKLTKVWEYMHHNKAKGLAAALLEGK